MLIRSRSARLAVLALAATPLVASYAAPASAVGSDAEVGATVDGDSVEVTSTKGLSRVTIVYCDGTTLVADSWSGDQKIGEVEIDGVVQAVFVHSGDNTTVGAQELLAQLAGPDAVKGNSTGDIALHNQGACDDETEEPPGTTEEPPGTTEEPDGIVDPDPDPDTSSDPTDQNPAPETTTGGDPTGPAPSVDVLGETIVKADNPAAAPVPAPATSPVVDSNTLSAGGELPRTGAGPVQFLVTLALSLLAAGGALRAAFNRRIRTASSPG